jgi:hypothetical protein
VLLCYDCQNGIIDEEEDNIFATKPNLFPMGTISLFFKIQYVKTIDVEIMDTNAKTSTSEHGFGVQNTHTQKMAIDMSQKCWRIRCICKCIIVIN